MIVTHNHSCVVFYILGALIFTSFHLLFPIADIVLILPKKMKRFFPVIFAFVAFAAFSAFVGRKYFDIWQQLSISQEDARESIFGNFQQGNLSFPYSTAIKGLIPGKRAAAVKEMGDYIRKCVNSPEFAEQYNAQRASAKPAAPAEGQDKVKRRLEEIKHDIAENETGMAQAKGDMKKLYEATIKMLKTEQKALLDPKDLQHEMFVSNLTGAIGEMTAEQYQQAVADFEKEYPATVNGLIKKRLKEFLELTKDMDFSAKLITSGRVKKFADPALEAKDGLWKRCFRSGEETVTTARAYAAQWLKELK